MWHSVFSMMMTACYRLFILRSNTRHVLEFHLLADVVFMQVHSHRHLYTARIAGRTASFGHKLPGTTERISEQGFGYVAHVSYQAYDFPATFHVAMAIRTKTSRTPRFGHSVNVPLHILRMV